MDNLLPFIRNLRPVLLRTFVRRIYFQYLRATWRQRALPDFLVIGAQHGGTTAFFDYLSQHPQLAPSFHKEVHFFDGGSKKEDIFEKGEAWYRGHFPRRRDFPEGALVFEASPLYIFHPLAPARISSLLPSVKLIALLRNPTERALSHYFNARGKNRDSAPMLEVFQRDEQKLLEMPAIDAQRKTDHRFLRDSYKSRGHYAEQLKRYLQYFSKEQILLLASEDLFRDTHQTLRSAFEFLGVDADFHVPDVRPRSRGWPKQEVPADVRKYLDDYFRPHNQALYELTGRDFGW